MSVISLAKKVGPLPLLLWFLHYSVYPELAFRLPIGSFLIRVQDSKCCFRQPSPHRLPRFRKSLRRPNRQIELSCEGVLERYSSSVHTAPSRGNSLGVAVGFYRGFPFCCGSSLLLLLKMGVFFMNIHTRAINSLTFVVFDSSASHAIVSSGRYTVFTTYKGR